jgi:hypothetical protein
MSVQLETIKIVEREDSSVGLERCNEDQLSLWRVDYTIPFQASVYVLANNKDSAISQAAYPLALESYSARGRCYNVQATATRVPLYICGWGGIQF